MPPNEFKKVSNAVVNTATARILDEAAKAFKIHFDKNTRLLPSDVTDLPGRRAMPRVDSRPGGRMCVSNMMGVLKPMGFHCVLLCQAVPMFHKKQRRMDLVAHLRQCTELTSKNLLTTGWMKV